MIFIECKDSYFFRKNKKFTKKYNYNYWLIAASCYLFGTKIIKNYQKIYSRKFHFLIFGNFLGNLREFLFQDQAPQGALFRKYSGEDLPLHSYCLQRR